MTRLIIELPLEVLQHIASSCPFRDVLAINRTCRRFRTACDDGFVFQQSFLNHVRRAAPSLRQLRAFLTLTEYRSVMRR